jgi:hypothetical protein
VSPLRIDPEDASWLPPRSVTATLQDRQALLACARAASESDPLQRVQALWEAIEFYVSGVAPRTLFDSAQAKRVRKAIPGDAEALTPSLASPETRREQYGASGRRCSCSSGSPRARRSQIAKKTRKEEHPRDEMAQPDAKGRRGLREDGRRGRNETEGTVNVGRKDRTAFEALNRFERVARAIQERARRLEILDRRALARREAEDRRLQEAERR